VKVCRDRFEIVEIVVFFSERENFVLDVGLLIYFRKRKDQRMGEIWLK